MKRHPVITAVFSSMVIFVTTALHTTAAADIVMRLGDNVNPSPSFPSAINSNSFAAGGEIRFLDPTGVPGGGPGDSNGRDIINGTEEWVFDSASGEMTGVVNTALTPGAVNVAGSACPGGCEGISQHGSLFFVPFGLVAPLVGNPAGNQYGPAKLNIIDAGNFTVFFPVLEIQWADTYFTLGSAGNQGVTFNCSGVPAGEFRCFMEHTIQVSEDVGLAGFPGWTVQMEFGTPAVVTVAIDVDGGTSQECAGPDGTAVSMMSNTTTPGGATLESISWEVDGAFFGTGPSIEPVLSLGTHTVTATAVTTGGDSATATTTVTVADTNRPNLVAAFRDGRTGEVISSIAGSRRASVEVSLEATDACDAEPQVTAAHLTPTYMTRDGDILVIKPRNGEVRLPITALSLQATATDASGNGDNASAVLEIIND